MALFDSIPFLMRASSSGRRRLDYQHPRSSECWLLIGHLSSFRAVRTRRLLSNDVDDVESVMHVQSSCFVHYEVAVVVVCPFSSPEPLGFICNRPVAHTAVKRLSMREELRGIATFFLEKLHTCGYVFWRARTGEFSLYFKKVHWR